MNKIIIVLSLVCMAAGCATLPGARDAVRVATFVSDATPPVGAPLCGGDVKPVASVDDPLHARGIVILPGGQEPIVLVSVDWVGIANGGQDRWRSALAKAAGTSVARVQVHVTHVHDAPFVDNTVEGLLARHGMAGAAFDVLAAERAVEGAAVALQESLKHARRVTHVGHGAGVVKEVASNRRILGADGKVRAIRWSATADAAVRAEPEGTIDPLGRVVSFWAGETPVAALTYYACHPQSKYGQGKVSADVPGVARAKMEAALGCPVVHFNGAAGNVTHGKYNDGDIANRGILGGRLFDGLRAGWEATQKYPVAAEDIVLDARALALPPRVETVEAEERALLKDAGADPGQRRNAAVEVAWIERNRAGVAVPVACLRLGPIRVLHMPGELFVEYQLAAQAMRPDLPVVMAAYGEYGMGYIGTCAAYPEGGYETQRHVSRTAPAVEALLMETMRGMLGAGR